jgi:PKD repeat protein
MKNILFLLMSVSLMMISKVNINAQIQHRNKFSDPSTSGVHKAKCLTMEVDSIRRAMNKNLPSLEQEENWLQEQILIFKQQQNARLSAGLPKSTILTLPIIFHVITSGSGPTNVAASRIQAQVDQLNIDYRNLAGSTNSAAGDVEIQFCLALRDPNDNLLAEPGIDRVTTYGSGTQQDQYIESTIKPATIWNTNQYINVWVVNLGGGLLGYAQLPSNSTLTGLNVYEGPAATDGVVILYNTLGSVASPNSAGAPYGLGRTLTHEMGHWLGLRHIWGDGSSCSATDYCNDTPPAKQANYGCPTGLNSCTGDNYNDMIENFMDYTDDACMNLFTLDQVTRMRTVLNVAARRSTLANSNKCTPISLNSPPVANFVANQTSVSQGSTVIFTDQSSNMPSTWLWNVSPSTGWTFTSGTTANSQNPQITFNSIGQYSITLTATNTNGNDQEIKLNYIKVNELTEPCTPSVSNPCDEYIQKVSLGTINNTTSCTSGGFADYTSISTLLTKGSSYTITVTPAIGSTVGAYTNDEIAVWIDYNNDFDFSDAGEQIGYVLVQNGWSNQFTFSVPNTASTGAVRMRTRISYSVVAEGGAPIDPCSVASFGEAEDYTVHIIDPGTTVAFVTISSSDNDNTICSGNTVTFSANPTNGGSAPLYQWQINGSNVGSNSSSVTFTTSSLANGQIVSCIMTSNLSGVIGSPVSSSNSFIMTVNNPPQTPTISQNGLILTSSSTSGNQWYRNGVAITGATSQSYSVTQNGNYTVIVSNSNCSSQASAIVSVTTLSLNEMSTEGTNLVVYPNPSNGLFSIILTTSEISKYRLSISNEIGQIIFDELLNDFTGLYSKNFDLTNFGRGTYFLTIENSSNEQRIEKVITY